MLFAPQGSPGRRQPVPRGQGSLEQERRWKQYLEDERIALFLQNEEFMKELQRNRDFLLALERGERPFRNFCFLGVCPAVALAAGSSALPVGSGLVPKQSQDKMWPGWGCGLSCPRCWAAPWTPALLPLPSPLQHL